MILDHVLVIVSGSVFAVDACSYLKEGRSPWGKVYSLHFPPQQKADLGPMTLFVVTHNEQCCIGFDGDGKGEGHNSKNDTA